MVAGAWVARDQQLTRELPEPTAMQAPRGSKQERMGAATLARMAHQLYERDKVSGKLSKQRWNGDPSVKPPPLVLPPRDKTRFE